MPLEKIVTNSGYLKVPLADYHFMLIPNTLTSMHLTTFYHLLSPIVDTNSIVNFQILLLKHLMLPRINILCFFILPELHILKTARLLDHTTYL